MKTCTRKQAIDDIREALGRLVDENSCICKVASEQGVFCGGFHQWDFDELKRQYPQIVRSRPRIRRRELEELANTWQLARKFVLDEPLACDLQVHESEFQTCKGWGEFSDEKIAKFHEQICGEPVEIRSE